MSSHLRWPADRTRTRFRQPALFRHKGGTVPFDIAMRRLEDELERIRASDVDLTMNVARSISGKIIGKTTPDDPGVAVYFRVAERPYALACDKWSRLADNVAALAAHLDALRGQDRWGVSEGIEQALAGHIALPPPRSCWAVLGIPEGSNETLIRSAHRRLAPLAHSDHGGSDAAMAELNKARDDALAAIKDGQ